MKKAVPGIRECTPADASTLAIIGAATLLDAYAGFLPGDALLAHCTKNHQPSAYEAELAQRQTRAWLAEVAPGRAPVGYAVVTSPDFPPELVGPGDLELRRIYVLSRFHGDGTGQLLMHAAIAFAREGGAPHLLVGLHANNHRAMHFYRKHGFERAGNRTFQLGGVVFDDPVLRLRL